MPVGFWIFFIIICILGFSYLKTGTYFGFLTGKKKEDARQQPETPVQAPPAVLDDDEIRRLGEAAADWCGRWMLDNAVNSKDKWLVIEFSTDHMDCRSITGDGGKYPHCTVEYSRKIGWDTAADVARKVLDVIAERCPNMISLYGLYADGHSLILPTNYN